MNSGDYIVLAVILAILAGAVRYIFKVKRSGKKCVGCPGGEGCNGTCPGCGLK